MEVQGTITRKYRLPASGDSSPVLGALSIAGASESGSPDAEVTITRATRVSRGAAAASSFDELRAGERVVVLFAGPTQETYPIRGVAAEVIVLDPVP